MNVAVEIAGRKALPVWTIPYVTGRFVSPDRLLEMLAKPDCDEGRYSGFPSPFHLDELGKPHILPPSQWSEAEGQIDKLEDNLDKKNLPSLEDRQQWCKQSIELIMPYRAYLWLDEFETFFENYRRRFDLENPEICLHPFMPIEHEEHFKKTEKFDDANKVGNLINFYLTKSILDSRFQTTTEEIAMWITTGELKAYRNKKFDKEEVPFDFHIRNFLEDDNYIAALDEAHFKRDEIEIFQPKKRYISRKALVQRWEYSFADKEELENFIRARAKKEGRLLEYHPITGVVETAGELYGAGVFDLNDVQKIEDLFDNKLLNERQKAVAEIKASRIPKSDWNIQQLLDMPLSELIQESGLLQAVEFDLWWHLFSWKKQLSNEMAQLKPSQYKDRKDYDDRI
ncbi:MAG: hypothetical protein IPN42_18315 [Methylococcaceae bacterium]|nr:hypothetical protein [Methylococcaceae bacterium]